MEEGIDVRALLDRTYSALAKRHGPSEIIFPSLVLTEIARDDDWHRTRVGSMAYDGVRLFSIGNKHWAIAKGERFGDYPAKQYDSDLLALEFSIDEKSCDQVQKELTDKIRNSSYFKNSLYCGMSDGSLSLGKRSVFKDKLLPLVQSEISRFTARPAEYEHGVYLLSTLQPVTTKCVLYKPEFADFLADSIEAVLK